VGVFRVEEGVVADAREVERGGDLVRTRSPRARAAREAMSAAR
jgi:hypothetical protein